MTTRMVIWIIRAWFPSRERQQRRIYFCYWCLPSVIQVYSRTKTKKQCESAVVVADMSFQLTLKLICNRSSGTICESRHKTLYKGTAVGPQQSSKRSCSTATIFAFADMASGWFSLPLSMAARRAPLGRKESRVINGCSHHQGRELTRYAHWKFGTQIG